MLLEKCNSPIRCYELDQRFRLRLVNQIVGIQEEVDVDLRLSTTPQQPIPRLPLPLIVQIHAAHLLMFVCIPRPSRSASAGGGCWHLRQ